MAYQLTPVPDGLELAVTAGTREDLFRDTVQGTLEAVYGSPLPEGSYGGQVVPVQAAGSDVPAQVAEIVSDCLRAVDGASGTLHPPRWMAFDEGRVTAHLPLTSPRADARVVLLRHAVAEAASTPPWAFRFTFAVAPAAP